LAGGAGIQQKITQARKTALLNILGMSAGRKTIR
jgi:hypothetical protein